MFFGIYINREKEWIDFKIEAKEYFELFINCDLDSLTEAIFEDYLMQGNNPHFHTPLAELINMRFVMLEKLADAWSMSGFYDALRVEQENRPNRYKG